MYCCLQEGKVDFLNLVIYIDLPVLPSTIGIIVYAKSCHVNQLWYKYNGMT